VQATEAGIVGRDRRARRTAGRFAGSAFAVALDDNHWWLVRFPRAGVVFASTCGRNGRSGIYVMDLDGEHIRPLTDDDTGYPSFSPDGTKIVYTRFTRDPASKTGAEIWVMNSDGSNPRRLTDPKQTAQAPSWGRGTDS
jgi:hypothetical protein